MVVAVGVVASSEATEGDDDMAVIVGRGKKEGSKSEKRRQPQGDSTRSPSPTFKRRLPF